jgi:hypothetical protein
MFSLTSPKFWLLVGFGAFVYWEFFYTPATADVTASTGTPNALGVPTAPINASTLSPAQLGSGLFENQSGLQTSPEDSYGV